MLLLVTFLWGVGAMLSFLVLEEMDVAFEGPGSWRSWGFVILWPVCWSLTFLVGLWRSLED